MLRERQDGILVCPSTELVRLAPACTMLSVDRVGDAVSVDWDAAAEAILRHGVLRFCLGELELGREETQQAARGLVAGLFERLDAVADLPPQARISWDPGNAKDVPEGHLFRTHLPHHDGGRSTFLVPSASDTGVPSAQVIKGVSRGALPLRLYSGFLLLHPGRALSLTTFFPLLPLTCMAYVRQVAGADPTRSKVARWLLETLDRYSKSHGVDGSPPYPNLPAMLGATARMHTDVVHNYVEAPFREDVLAHVPELAASVTKCGCGTCRSGPERLLCIGLEETIGLTWPETRGRFEICVPSERLDLVMWNNVFVRHGGLMGGPARLFEPVHIVLDALPGLEYDTWLDNGWRRGTGSESFGRRDTSTARDRLEHAAWNQ